MKAIYFSLFVACFNCLYSQETGVRLNPVGVYISKGISKGVNDLGAQIHQRFEGMYYELSTLGVYCRIPLSRSDSAKGIFRYFRFIRPDLYWSSRSGAFEGASGSIASVTQVSYGINVIVPFHFEVGNGRQGYAGVGLGVGNSYRSGVTPDLLASEFARSSNFLYSINWEFGFPIGKNSFISLRPLDWSIGDFKYTGASLLFGFSPQPIERKK